MKRRVREDHTLSAYNIPKYILIAPQGKVKEIYIKTRRKIPQSRVNLCNFAPGSPLTEKKEHDKMFPHADVVELGSDASAACGG